MVFLVLYVYVITMADIMRAWNDLIVILINNTPALYTHEVRQENNTPNYQLFTTFPHTLIVS